MLDKQVEKKIFDLTAMEERIKKAIEDVRATYLNCYGRIIYQAYSFRK